ncbi:MAG: hypothetical protein PVF77_01660 [Anaerolineae bacterium]
MDERIAISTWFYQLTGKIYRGAFVSALVAWMFTSSQVMAPIPVWIGQVRTCAPGSRLHFR